MVWAIKQFSHYLAGSKFKVVTDHSSLKYLMDMKDPNGKLAWWGLYLQTFEFLIEHRSGKSHSNADFLNRPIVNLARLEKNKK